MRKDIAKILTVVHARRLGEEIMEAPVRSEVREVEAAVGGEPEAAVAEPEAQEAEAVAEETDEETPENVETAEEAPAPAPAARRTSRRKTAGEQE